MVLKTQKHQSKACHIYLLALNVKNTLCSVSWNKILNLGHCYAVKTGTYWIAFYKHHSESCITVK